MYEIELADTARKFIHKLEKKDAELVLRNIYSIRDDPFRFLKRLQGEKLWRLRIADYRAVVDVVVSGRKVIVLRIGHRRDVYD